MTETRKLAGLLVILGGVALALAACPSKDGSTSGSADAAGQGAEDKPPVHEIYHVFDNGTRCVTAPCPSWTAKSGTTSTNLHSIDISPLGLNEEDSKKVRGEVYKGFWKVSGRIMSTATGGQKLLIIKLVEKTTPPKRLEERTTPPQPPASTTPETFKEPNKG